MNNIIALREKRAKAWESAKAFLDSKRDGNDMLSAEDAVTYDKMEAEVLNFGKEIERLERGLAIERELSEPTSQPLTSTVGKPSKASDEYKTAFWNAMRGRQVSGALKVGTDSDGGYLVPDEFERTLIEALQDQNLFRQIARIIQTSSGERKIPVVATKGTATWVDEGGQILESNDTFSQVSLSAFKLATMMKVSEELMNDSAFDLESYIAREFARRIGDKEEEAFLVGDGAGKPSGILKATGGASLGVTAGSQTTISIDEMIELYHSLRSPYRNQSVFITNDLTIKVLRKLKDGHGQYLWQPSIRDGLPDTLLGKPIYTSTFMPKIAAGAKTVLFGDFSYYWIADRQGRIFKRLNELFATTGQIGFIATQRVDGKLILPEAVKFLQQA